jgi:Mn-dependent DtxR family transcriptional regulator
MVIMGLNRIPILVDLGGLDKDIGSTILESVTNKAVLRTKEQTRCINLKGTSVDYMTKETEESEGIFDHVSTPQL